MGLSPQSVGSDTFCREIASELNRIGEHSAGVHYRIVYLLVGEKKSQYIWSQVFCVGCCGTRAKKNCFFPHNQCQKWGCENIMTEAEFVFLHT